MPTVVLATGNKGKIKELRYMLSRMEPDITVKGLKDFPDIGDIEETGSTFLENARIKAETVSRATGLVAIADDSGLEVDALNGAPGVISARYSAPDPTDEKNNDKLLRELASVPADQRTARFRCVMVACSPDDNSIEAEGAWEGRIALEPRGSGGFGYDPLFIDTETGLSAAQLDPKEKNARSHRGKALKKLMQRWPEFWKNSSKNNG